MAYKSLLQRILVSLLLSLAIFQVGALQGTAGTTSEPPLPGERITGPAIEGVFTAVPSTNPNEALITFAGTCKKISVSFGPAPFPLGKAFANVIASDIENQIRIPNSAAQALCFPGEIGELLITGVSKFSNNGQVMGAIVSVSLVQAK